MTDTTTTNTVQDGSSVKLHYRGTLEDGTEFDSSRERDEAMTVTTGAGQLIAGFNDALIGMAAGETKTFTLTAAEAYGDVDPDNVTQLERNIFPEDFEFSDGMTVPLSNQSGENFMAVITEVTEETVTANFNHPLAGKDLTFEVEVLEVS
jgi:FKBP-type peptidyl-prolyl cis-trans isomerase 2